MNDIEVTKKNSVEKIKGVAKETGVATANAAKAVKGSVAKSQKAVVNAIDVNGNGKIDIEDIITLGLRVPGIRIKRKEFLQKELQKNYSQETIDTAIQYTPVKANIPKEDIDHIANEVIKYERNCVSGISAALGAPGGIAMVATIPVDIAQYYGYMLRATQKLMYLYGFPELNVEENEQSFDSETMNILIICLGVMYGVSGAGNALRAMANGLASGIEKKIMRTAVTKGTLYPIIVKTLKWFDVKMTKQVLANFFKKVVPVAGGVIGGGLTYISFKPCCDKLKASLEDTLLSNPDHESDKEEKEIELMIESDSIEL